MSGSLLTLERDGNRVRFTVEVSAAGKGFHFEFQAPNEWSASLLTQAVRAALGDAMSEARKEAYADGWRDAKAKRARAKWFGQRLP